MGCLPLKMEEEKNKDESTQVGVTTISLNIEGKKMNSGKTKAVISQ